MPEIWSLLFKGQNSLPDNTLVRYGSFIVKNLPRSPVFLYSPEKEKIFYSNFYYYYELSDYKPHITHLGYQWF